jgi:hypothetical protein
LRQRRGYWIRTLKTGHVTDNFLGLKFRGFIEWLSKLPFSKKMVELEGLLVG